MITSPCTESFLRLVFFLSIFIFAGCKPEPTVLVDTAVGRIGGLDAGTHQTFLGIPYAQPPVGDLRWQAPQALPPFKDTYNATQAGSGCEQFGAGAALMGGDEDCLFLNIWRPSEEKIRLAGGELPVMVFIHGGAFTLGKSTESFYDGSKLAESRNLIVVSINYRLGYLGFLALPELTAEAGQSGNYIFYDQQLALQWVHDNIGAFGGDANRIMLFGESAGAISTCMLLASPKSSALIYSAAIQSGFCHEQVLTQTEAEQAGVEFANNAGCGVGDRLTCLRNKSISEINKALKKSGLVEKFLSPSPSVPVIPVIDGEFLDQPPRDLLRQGSASGKSIIIGSNAAEGALFTAFHSSIADEQAYLSILESEYGENASQVAALYPFSAYSSGLAAYSDLVGDRFFTCTAKATAAALVEGGSDVYYYQFRYPVKSPLVTLFEWIAPSLDFRFMHGAEMPYVFGVNALPGEFKGEDLAMLELMQRYWSNTASIGTPNNSSLPSWPLYRPETFEYLKLDSPSPSVAADLKTRKCALLNSLALISI